MIFRNQWCASGVARTLDRLSLIRLQGIPCESEKDITICNTLSNGCRVRLSEMRLFDIQENEQKGTLFGKNKEVFTFVSDQTQNSRTR
jgi:hypothetical protein